MTIIQVDLAIILSEARKFIIGMRILEIPAQRTFI